MHNQAVALVPVALVRVVTLVVLGLAGAAGSGCDGCATPATSHDAGPGGEGEGEGGEGEGEGARDAGFVDAGPPDAGDNRDAGNGFDLGAFLDGGAGACLPDQLPTLSITGALDALGLGLYSGGAEDGVRCGVDPRVTCAPGSPCCVLCGLAGCAIDVDGGAAPTCPVFTNAYNCDGDEDCSGSDICCFTLTGTECRQPSDCNFDVNAAITNVLEAADGGFHLRDGGFVDGGFEDGGFTETPVDGGFIDGGPVDGGFIETPVVGPAGPVPDAGTLLDGLQSTLEQGVPVCRSSLFDCDIIHGEACCSSDRLPAVDVGFCLPALLCLGSVIP